MEPLVCACKSPNIVGKEAALATRHVTTGTQLERLSITVDHEPHNTCIRLEAGELYGNSGLTPRITAWINHQQVTQTRSKRVQPGLFMDCLCLSGEAIKKTGDGNASKN